MKCSRKGCKNEADFSTNFGILPCKEHQKTESSPFRKRYQFANIGKLDRIQRQRDRHSKDLLQPYEKNKPNKDFFKAFPDLVDTYNVRKELEYD